MNIKRKKIMSIMFTTLIILIIPYIIFYLKQGFSKIEIFFILTCNIVFLYGVSRYFTNILISYFFNILSESNINFNYKNLLSQIDSNIKTMNFLVIIIILIYVYIILIVQNTFPFILFPLAVPLLTSTVGNYLNKVFLFNGTFYVLNRKLSELVLVSKYKLSQKNEIILILKNEEEIIITGDNRTNEEIITILNNRGINSL